MTFAPLGLAEPLLRAIASEGYGVATPIQARSIPAVLAGKDLLGCAQTGTGKTGAFALPILHRLVDAASNAATARGRRDKRPRALVLCPTRELASQITASLMRYGRHVPVRHLAIFGGVPQTPQVRKLRAGVDVLVATPGRLLDLMNQGHVDLSAVGMLVLDEADRMLDMGFIHDIRRIVAEAPAERQTLLFSATMPRAIERLAASHLRDPVRVEVTPAASTVDTIAQSVYHVAKPEKAALLRKVLAAPEMGRALVFSRTKHGADKIVRGLRQAGVHADAIHGNKSQGQRTRALDGFRSGRTRVLVATDIASRGIDVRGVTHVVNYDLPPDGETYVHRIGRTARAGESGVAISFCGADERGSLRAIERTTKQKLDRAGGEPGPGPTPRSAPRSRKNTRGPSGGGPRRGPRGGPAKKKSNTHSRRRPRRAEAAHG